jgi:DNA-3-methyladenine glycosylase I
VPPQTPSTPPTSPATSAAAPPGTPPDAVSEEGLRTGEDGRRRCWWCGTDPLYVAYHDEEWGVEVTDEVRLFEKLCLEGFQAGLSWLTILRKRPAFREAFADFVPERVAAFGDDDVARLLADPGIVRNRAKIEATIHNARRYLELVDARERLTEIVWRHAPVDPPVPRTRADVPSQTPESRALARELKRRGWRFVGPTTVYAFMEAMGLVDDHLEGCVARRA